MGRLSITSEDRDYAEREWAITYYERIFNRLRQAMQYFLNNTKVDEKKKLLIEVIGMCHILELYSQSEHLTKEMMLKRRLKVIKESYGRDEKREEDGVKTVERVAWKEEWATMCEDVAFYWAPFEEMYGGEVDA